MRQKIFFKGQPMTLAGRLLKTGEAAPDFSVHNADLKTGGLADFKDKIKLITTFLSLDTPVCDLQVKEFNKEAAGLSKEAVILGISKDLPFAQKRFCSSNSIKDVITLSDYKNSSFGINYGLLIKELGLLARSVLVIDKTDVIRYFQICGEQTSAPDYKAALKALGEVVQKPVSDLSGLGPQKCRPCEGKVPALAVDEAARRLGEHSLWTMTEAKSISRDFKFKDFSDAKYFLDLVSVIAEEQGHHPRMTLSYGGLKITLTTHAAGGLTDNDFLMAGIIDSLAREET
jgi:thioredoxin-dependent peroxiredoxin